MEDDEVKRGQEESVRTSESTTIMEFKEKNR